ncbi:MAG: RimK family alpha-L-glutamate ligase, partial [Mesorhizobium sp.]
ADDGNLFILEVNSMPAWSGLQSVVAVNIAEAIADALLKLLADRAEAAAAPRPYRFAAPANS